MLPQKGPILEIRTGPGKGLNSIGISNGDDWQSSLGYRWEYRGYGAWNFQLLAEAQDGLVAGLAKVFIAFVRFSMGRGVSAENSRESATAPAS